MSGTIVRVRGVSDVKVTVSVVPKYWFRLLALLFSPLDAVVLGVGIRQAETEYSKLGIAKIETSSRHFC